MPFLAPVAPIIGAVATVASVGVSLIGMMAQQSAAQQAAANAQAMANYNAQIQQQNAQVAYQMQVAQAQQAAAAAQSNYMIAQQNAQYLQAQQAVEQQIAQQNQEILRRNADLSRTQAEAARLQYQAGLNNAKDQDAYAEVIRAQQREEARRMREESAQRIAAIRAKYAGSGVTFEGSPLIVLADAAQLAETSVQDAAYISELETRKVQRAAELTRFQAGFSLIDEAGFLNQAASYEAQANASRLTAAIDVFGLQTKQYSAEVEAQNYLNQVATATYDTQIAGVRKRIALNEAELTRFEGGVQAQAYRAQGQAAMISGIGSAIGGVSNLAGSLYKPKYSTPGLVS